MNGLVLASIKTRLTLSSNDENKHERTIETYAEVLKHLLRRFATDGLITKAAEEIGNFEQGSLTTRDFSRK